MSDAPGERLRAALFDAGMAAAIAPPVTHLRLLETVVEAAMRVIGARAAALCLILKETQEMVFEVAFGQRAEAIKQFRIPVGHGIAGLVAASGQPMAVSDAQRDPRHASDIGRQVGYVPKSILCVPLFSGDEVIGVLELLDKEGATAFSAADMESLSLFANPAAMAIDLSRTYENLTARIGAALRASEPGEPNAVDESPSPDAYERAIALASLVREVADRGEAESRACHGMLVAFADYLRSRPAAFGEWGAPR